MLINIIDTDNPEAAMDATGYQPPPRSNAEDLLDDVFGDNQSTHSQEPTLNAANSLPSDVPRLEREHTTAGYRDGITAAKAQSMQGGFDEGFSLGASVGSRVGQVLGLLDGIAESVTGAGAGAGTGDDGSASQLVVGLARQAREELTVEKVFGQEYWFSDGTWRYRISKDGAAEHENIVFEDVADAHPLIVKWTAVVQEQMKRWNVNMNVLAASTETAIASEAKEPVTPTKPTVEPKNALLDW